MDVLTMGEALACFAPLDGLIDGSERFVKSYGGAELNTAVGLARLGNDVAWVSRVGADPIGDELMGVLHDEGVDTSLVHRAPGEQTALMLKERVTPHETRVYYYRKGSAASRLRHGDLDRDAIHAASVVHVTGVSLSIGAGPRAFVLDAVEVAAEAGIPVSFDPNFRPQLISADDASAVTRAILPHVTHLLCNQAEAALISGHDDPVAAARAIAAMGPQVVVVKRGASGSVAIVDGTLYEQPAYFVEHPVDPVGAGDAFNAGWLHSRIHGMEPETGLGLASFVAAQVVQHPGDHEGFPSAAQVERWLTEGSGASGASRSPANLTEGMTTP